MKKIILRKEEKELIKKAIIVFPIVVVFAFLITLAIKLDQDFMESCMEQGYSKEYCEINR